MVGGVHLGLRAIVQMQPSLLLLPICHSRPCLPLRITIRIPFLETCYDTMFALPQMQCLTKHLRYKEFSIHSYATLSYVLGVTYILIVTIGSPSTVKHYKTREQTLVRQLQSSRATLSLAVKATFDAQVRREEY
jgi:hypothetical protein